MKSDYAKDLAMAALSPSRKATQSSTATSATHPTFDFGPTYVKMPRGRHLATIVWLHGLGDTGYLSSHFVETLPLDNIKWILPTAPTRSLSVFAGLPGAAWFDPGNISDENESPECIDFEGLNATAEHIAQILAHEPIDVKLGIGGFSLGAAAALYTVTHFVLGDGKNHDTVRSLGNITTVLVLSGWLPSYRTMKRKLDNSSLGTVLRVKELNIYIAHGRDDDVVSLEYGGKSAFTLRSCGFQKLTCKTFEGLGHDICDLEIRHMCVWLTDALQLQGY